MTTSTKRRRYTSHSKPIRDRAMHSAAAKHHNRKLFNKGLPGSPGVGEREARMSRARRTVARKQGRRSKRSNVVFQLMSHLDPTTWWRSNKGRRRK